MIKNGLQSRQLYDSAISCSGHKRFSIKDWVEASAGVLILLMERKREALLEHKNLPNQQTEDALRQAKSSVQRETRCANEYWTSLCKDVQSASDMGDTRKAHGLLKTALGPNISKTATLKSEDGDLIVGKEKQLDRWVQHYPKLYFKGIPLQRGLETVLPLFAELTDLDLKPCSWAGTIGSN